MLGATQARDVDSNGILSEQPRPRAYARAEDLPDVNHCDDRCCLGRPVVESLGVQLCEPRSACLRREAAAEVTSLELLFDAAAATKLGTDRVTIGFDAAACDAAELQAVIALGGT